MRSILTIFRGVPAVSKSVETSDAVLTQYLGASLQTATIRLAAVLIVVSAVLAAVITIL
jgi:hypothetical protein